MLQHPIDPAGIETRIIERQVSCVGDVERQAGNVTVTPTGHLDHRLAPVDGHDPTAGRNELRKRRGVVPESATDLQYLMPSGAKQVITLALALGEKRERVNQKQTGREQREIRGTVDALKPRREVIGLSFPFPLHLSLS